MNVIATALPEVLIIEPKVFGDSRGFFFESFNAREFARLTGAEVEFVQDNHSRSGRGVLRGLHYQVANTQGKLVRVVQGEIRDVAVDVRRHSPTFGQWVAVHLSAENHRQLWIPAGFAHGFAVMGDSAEFLYKTTDYYNPQADRCIRWDDPTLAIDWGLQQPPVLSDKDKVGVSWAEAQVLP
ncbi:UNVERIFIED_ORG: dTDP-4-dehydrorhamnose 3,5-epimerase [Pseudomonas parafulva]|jgi:dTDP-4-dehydrorhamnose 3,5-epimerase|uniref:dTDP-4-dehydrorhamnose 3,5-epimerase n=1 Tax=Pseudomonas fulva TaxID=47880 RepID=A0A7S9Q8X5_9PSED|nr:MULTISPECIES: dTDP-4-dehydrorhamnose 3,5-epimerase [Pseudomonas]MCY4124541.1 dTDP-4-dehydrorhamnose 3,5-epimerase [Pseudomonas sp.]MDP9556186.1 dTDP-4-dehydrorhamnose 3,5-epimerase [Pseudomonas parafulva]MDP9663806.1 dTDP-4-dehydrorhamnose 3,5-epimerase [Pseudomonas cremoricolorata]AVF53812.1 dTDP-4-dehydrorhamnose 3,5-epimerase [Pseudomonas fulva]MBF8774487.1 dTDP-4-dehydrorhamnose 3,5-epimerase [Pseudomonas fulva]